MLSATGDRHSQRPTIALDRETAVASRPPFDREATEAFFLDHLQEIDRLVAKTCRRFGLRPQDAEDFASEIRIRLIENDYAVIRRFRRESCWRTFLESVVRYKCSDYLDRRNGKWRASRRAIQLGRAAVELETLHVRDGLTLHEAVEHVLRRQGGLSRRQMLDLAAALPERCRRVFLGEERLAGLTTTDGGERALEERETAAATLKIQAAFGEALSQLEADERLLLSLRYRDGLSFAAIARKLRLRQRAIYTHWNRCKRRLRQSLELRGVTAEEVRRVVGRAASSLEVDLKCPLATEKEPVESGEIG